MCSRAENAVRATCMISIVGGTIAGIWNETFTRLPSFD